MSTLEADQFKDIVELSEVPVIYNAENLIFRPEKVSLVGWSTYPIWSLDHGRPIFTNMGILLAYLNPLLLAHGHVNANVRM